MKTNVVDLKSWKLTELEKFWKESVVFWVDFLSRAHDEDIRRISQESLDHAKKQHKECVDLVIDDMRAFPGPLRSEEERRTLKAKDMLYKRVRVVATTRSEFKMQLGTVCEAVAPGVVMVNFRQGLGIVSFDIDQLEVVS